MISSFEKVSQLIVKECVLNYAPQSFDLDPIPSKLLKECLNSILPSLTNLFNSSLTSGIFQQFLKSAIVSPILKKRCLDYNNLTNYRPVSNLCFIAKILEKTCLIPSFFLPQLSQSSQFTVDCNFFDSFFYLYLFY